MVPEAVKGAEIESTVTVVTRETMDLCFFRIFDEFCFKFDMKSYKILKNDVNIFSYVLSVDGRMSPARMSRA